MHLINACDIAPLFSKLLGALEPYLPPASYGPEGANTITRKGVDISRLQCHSIGFHLLTQSLEMCSNMGKLVTFLSLRVF